VVRVDGVGVQLRDELAVRAPLGAVLERHLRVLADLTVPLDVGAGRQVARAHRQAHDGGHAHGGQQRVRLGETRRERSDVEAGGRGGQTYRRVTEPHGSFLRGDSGDHGR
jgi:hypothetical protein